jgi:hypothetical protein
VKDQHLITVDELRAAGALDVPAAWRKSLAVERDLDSGLFDNEETLPETQEPSPHHSDEIAPKKLARRLAV